MAFETGNEANVRRNIKKPQNDCSGQFYICSWNIRVDYLNENKANFNVYGPQFNLKLRSTLFQKEYIFQIDAISKPTVTMSVSSSQRFPKMRKLKQFYGSLKNCPNPPFLKGQDLTWTMLHSLSTELFAYFLNLTIETFMKKPQFKCIWPKND